ncbi:MAG: twin-arginine translocation signal domain-containing protein [Burkholderiales bacterium]
MERRGFIKFCAASAAALGAPAVPGDARAQTYARARLVDETGQPLRAGAVPVNRNLIFHYPFAATPCFLLNLGKPVAAPVQLKTAENQPYEWKGGIGPGHSVVAYSAICAHKLSYPTRDISFISFRTETSARNRHASVIHCCSEHSQYDPAAGAKVVAGPAPQPLAAILLEHDAGTDDIYAVGTLGGEMFNQFFEKYAFKLALEYPTPKNQIAGSCVVHPLDNYCRQQVKC